MVPEGDAPFPALAPFSAIRKALEESLPRIRMELFGAPSSETSKDLRDLPPLLWNFDFIGNGGSSFTLLKIRCSNIPIDDFSAKKGLRYADACD